MSWSPLSKDPRQIDIEETIAAVDKCSDHGETPPRCTTQGRYFSASQVIENTASLDTKKEAHKSSNYRFQWEKVNSVTWKLTDGAFTQVPASHGHWSGYRITKAIAWVIDVGSAAWLARCGDQAVGPTSLNDAKAAAIAMAKGGAGAYRVRDLIRSLNALAAEDLDREKGAKPTSEFDVPVDVLGGHHRPGGAKLDHQTSESILGSEVRMRRVRIPR
jgi:hypothetical protein